MRLATIRVHRGSPSRSGATPRHLRPGGARELVAGYLASAEPDVGDDIVAAELLGRIAVATGVPAMAQGCFASAAQACFDLGDHARGAAALAAVAGFFGWKVRAELRLVASIDHGTTWRLVNCVGYTLARVPVTPSPALQVIDTRRRVVIAGVFDTIHSTRIELTSGGRTWRTGGAPAVNLRPIVATLQG